MSLRPFIFSIAAILFALPVQAAVFPTTPTQGYISDNAQLLNSEDTAYIQTTTQALFNEQKIPLVVVTIPSLVQYKASTMTVDEYATQLFNKWQIGSEKHNYGILFLVSKGDRKARIELGEGWSHRHDADAQEIMNTLIIPQFKQGNYSQGIRDGVAGMDALVRGLSIPTPPAPKWLIPAMLGGLVLFVLLVISLFKSGKKGWAWALLAIVGAIIFFAFKVGGKSGGIGRGGRSGGGGASGSW